jgi:hypothetical protein
MNALGKGLMLVTQSELGLSGVGYAHKSGLK